MFYSIILTAINNPDEVESFLESITLQQNKNFEIIFVDGSPNGEFHSVIGKYKSLTNLIYFQQKRLGVSELRNIGCEKAKGDFLVFIDSDCIIPPDYLVKVDGFLNANPGIDAYGGTEVTDTTFSDLQRAIHYAMTSMLTTGGIRGNIKQVWKFMPRSFNMGVRREVFFKEGGFCDMQASEDTDLSIRIQRAGYQTILLKGAFVYHRRKYTYKTFFRQIFFQGIGRIDLHLKHGDALKPVHMLPSVFIVGIIFVFFSKYFRIFFLGLLLIYILSIFVDSSLKNKSIKIGALSIISSLELLGAYGLGVWYNLFARMLLNKGSGKGY